MTRGRAAGGAWLAWAVGASRSAGPRSPEGAPGCIRDETVVDDGGAGVWARPVSGTMMSATAAVQIARRWSNVCLLQPLGARPASCHRCHARATFVSHAVTRTGRGCMGLRRTGRVQRGQRRPRAVTVATGGTLIGYSWNRTRNAAGGSGRAPAAAEDSQPRSRRFASAVTIPHPGAWPRAGTWSEFRRHEAGGRSCR